MKQAGVISRSKEIVDERCKKYIDVVHKRGTKMSTEHRITYDSASLIISLEQELDKFNIFHYDSRYQNFLVHITECINIGTI